MKVLMFIVLILSFGHANAADTLLTKEYFEQHCVSWLISESHLEIPKMVARYATSSEFLNQTVPVGVKDVFLQAAESKGTIFDGISGSRVPLEIK